MDLRRLMDNGEKITEEVLNDCDGRLRTSRCFYRINRRDISFLRFILEAYDGAAVLTTEDARRGIVGITTAPGCRALIEAVITSLAEAGEIMAEPVRGDGW